MKPHEKDLRYQGATRSIQWGGLPVASNVEPEFGQLLGASADVARELLAQGEERDGQWHTRECWSAECGCIVACQSVHRALKKAGVL